MIYRQCTASDFTEVYRLLKQLLPGENLDKDALQHVFMKAVVSDSQYYLCAEKNGKIVGFCSLTVMNNLWQQGNLGHIDELVVDSEYRKKGVGEGLLTRICKIAREMTCGRIELDSAYHRIEAHRFYQKHMFEDRAILFTKILEK